MGAQEEVNMVEKLSVVLENTCIVMNRMLAEI